MIICNECRDDLTCDTYSYQVTRNHFRFMLCGSCLHSQIQQASNLKKGQDPETKLGKPGEEPVRGDDVENKS